MPEKQGSHQGVTLKPDVIHLAAWLCNDGARTSVANGAVYRVVCCQVLPDCHRSRRTRPGGANNRCYVLISVGGDKKAGALTTYF